MEQFLDRVNRTVWGAPTLILILGTGIFFSLWLGFPQLRLFFRAVKLFFGKLVDKGNPKGVSSFQALCTALAATVGTGNLVGVAGAIALGGPGSIFWMWICALFGMVIKFAEATLAVRFRAEEKGEYLGGPMYMISRGLSPKWHFLAPVYCVLGIFAAFGVGNATQINAVITGVCQMGRFFGLELGGRDRLLLGILLALLIGRMLFGGARGIGQAAERLIPFVSCGYLLLCLWVLILRRSAIAGAFSAIIQGAFSPRAVTGGMLGSVFQVLRVGISRGVFTNEAGMGTASIAHAAAKVDHPCQQGLMGIMEVFLDTVVICTMTALVILCSGIPIPYGTDVGGELTFRAFSAVCGDGITVFLSLALCCFAFATVLGWGLYGARCAQYLFGSGSWKTFALAQAAMVILGAVLDTGVIWSLAEILNGLMAIPNLIALVGLRAELRRLTDEYRIKRGNFAAGGTYENLNQRKPL